MNQITGGVMKFKTLQTSAIILLILASTLLFAQKKLLHIDHLNNAAAYEKYADVEGFLLIDENVTQPIQYSVFDGSVVVMDGWPVKENGSTNRGGVYANLDDDAELEIIFNIGTKTYAFNIDGTYVDGWPKAVSSSPEYGAPAYGDIDGDGFEEVVVSCRQPGTGNTGRIYAFESDGTTVTGFPIYCDGGPTRTPVLADLNDDGAMEIIVELRDYPDGRVCVYHGDASIMDGWPVSMDYIPASSVAVGDITGDDVPEIIAESYYKVWAFSIYGDTLPGFPYEPGANRVFSYSSPVIADLDGFGSPVIIVGDHSLTAGNGAIHIIKKDGTAYAGWPKYTSNWIYGPPSVADIDGDGSLDVAVGDQVLSGVPSDYVFGWNKYGENLPGFPIGPIWAVNSQIIVADLDGDNLLELMFDDNTGEGIYNGYNHDGTMMEGWPIDVEGTSFFINPMALDANGDGMLNLNGGGFDSNTSESWIYLWDAGVGYNEELAVLPVLQYNVRHTGVYGEKGNPTVGLDEINTNGMLSVSCFPNPCVSQTKLSIKIVEAGNLSLSVIDLKGSVIDQVNYGTTQQGNTQLQLSTSGFDAGMYFLQLSLDGVNVSNTKLLVEK
jgi:hypothetical protein